MLKFKNVIALLITAFMLCLVGCTGDPAEETEQVVYNTTFYSNQSTQATSKITEKIYNSKSSSFINKERFVETVSTIDASESTLNTNKQTLNNTNQTSIKNDKVVVDVIKPTTTIKYNQDVYTTNVKENDKTVSHKATIKNFDEIKTTKSTIITKIESVVVSKHTTSHNLTTTYKTDYTSTSNSIQTTTNNTTQTTTLPPLRDDEICYITANGEKYHRQGCRYLKRSCIEIIVGEAKEKNYTPCKICKP